MSTEYITEAERQIIGGIIVFGLSDEYCRYALDNLDSIDFMTEPHKSLFNHLKNTYNENRELDVVELMQKTSVSRECLEELSMCCLTTANLKSYVEMLKKRTADNRILNGITSIANADDKFNELEKLYISEKEYRERENQSTLQKDVQQYIDFINHINEPIDERERIKTGFGTIDKYIGGFRKKSISVIGHTHLPERQPLHLI